MGALLGELPQGPGGVSDMHSPFHVCQGFGCCLKHPQSQHQQVTLMVMAGKACIALLLACLHAVQSCFLSGAIVVVEHVTPVMTVKSIHVPPFLHTAAASKHMHWIVSSTSVVLAALPTVGQDRSLTSLTRTLLYAFVI